MTIENFISRAHPERTLESLDHTFGYDDMLVVATTNGLNLRPDVGPAHARGVNLTQQVSEEQVRGLAYTGDSLYRLPNGSILLRRPIFTNPCSESQISNHNVLPMTETAARALAYFSRNMTDRAWCRPEYNGVEQGSVPDQVVPWDLNRREDIEELLGVLNRIQSAKDQPSTTSELGRQLVSALPQTELDRLKREVQAKLTSAQNLVERWLEKGHWEQFKDIAFAAVIFTVVGHPVGGTLSFLWNGFKGPDDRDGPGGGLRLSWGGIKSSAFRGVRAAAARWPRAQNTTNTARREALPDIVTGILAYHRSSSAAPVAFSETLPIAPVATGNQTPALTGIAIPAVGGPAVAPQFVPAIP